MSEEVIKVRGIIQGEHVKLEQTTGLKDGTEVIVILLADPTPESIAAPVPGAGLIRSFGAWKGDDEEGLDAYLEWNREQRKIERRNQFE